MIYQVIDLVIAMDQRCLVHGLRCRVSKKGDHVIEMRDLSHRNVSLDVNGLGLRPRDGPEGLDLAVVEAGRFPVV